jgi:predicted ATP-binding protein involved in virulence
MKIKKLQLKNYRRFADLDISFESANENKTTVLIGNNGAGKTSILDALVLNLSWLIARVNYEKGTGQPIGEHDILNGQASAFSALTLEYGGESYSWQIAKTRKGKEKGFTSNLKDVTQLAGIFRKQLTENDTLSLPLVAYYPVERGVIEIPLKAKARQKFDQLDGYENFSKQGLDFRSFFEWFRAREDVENEILSEKIRLVNEKLTNFISHDQDKQLSAVRRAIETFMPDLNNLRVKRKPRLRMTIEKKGSKSLLDVKQLSQGEKSLMTLVGDIARRLAMMNPALENPLDGEGVVMIDEIDMHLHPSWQQTVLANLVKTFPNVQFIVTTHSPQVISTVPSHQIRILDEDKVYSAEAGTQGAEASRILRDVFGVELRAQHLEIVKKLNRYLALIDSDEWDTPEALALRQTLNEWSQGHEPELIKADIDIRMKEFQRQL